MKKKKKQKDIVPELVLVGKIRDVKINEKQHFLLFVSILIFFNLLLLMSVWFVLIRLNEWYYWAICVALLALSFYLSFKTYRETKIFHKCELYENAISINSIWFNLNVELKDICEMQVKESRLDKIFKLGTKSLEVKILNRKRKKFIIHFIEEDAVKLKQEITMLIDRYTAPHKKIKTSEDKKSVIE